MALATQATINSHTFSRYECQIACAVQLYVRNANGQVPNDETLSYIIKYMRGQVGGTPLPCQHFVIEVQYHGREDHRAIYLSVYIKWHDFQKQTLTHIQVLQSRPLGSRSTTDIRRMDESERTNCQAVRCFSSQRCLLLISIAELYARLKDIGQLEPFLNPDGTLKTQDWRLALEFWLFWLCIMLAWIVWYFISGGMMVIFAWEARIRVPAISVLQAVGLRSFPKKF